MNDPTLYCLAAAALAVLTVRTLWRNAWTAGLFYLVLAGAFGFVMLNHGERLFAQANTRLVAMTTARPDHVWPPVVGQPYPDLRLVDQQGRRTSLSEFRGKVILVEPVGLPCPACVALSGGHRCGPFRDVAPQPGLRSLDEYARRLGRFDLLEKEIVFVQVLLYGSHMGAPSAADAREWARHFGLDRRRNQVVLAGEPYLVGPETRAMIPGLHLIDKDFTLRCLTGNHTEQDLYGDLLPSVRRLVNE